MRRTKRVLTLRESGVVVVEELLAVEGLETLEDTEADAASTDGSDDLALEVEGVARNIGHLPVTTLQRHRMRSRVREKRKTLEPTSIISCAGTKFRTRRRMDMTTCSATETTFEPVTSMTAYRGQLKIHQANGLVKYLPWMPLSTAAFKST